MISILKSRFESWRALSLAAAVLIVPLSALAVPDATVTAVQQALKDRQFYFEQPSGTLDEPTYFALRRFQIRYGLPVTGQIDTATREALEYGPDSSRVAQQVPEPSDAVRSYQETPGMAGPSPLPQFAPPPVSYLASARRSDLSLSTSPFKVVEGAGDPLGKALQEGHGAMIYDPAGTSTPDARAPLFERRNVITRPPLGTETAGPEAIEPPPRDNGGGLFHRLFHRDDRN